MVDNEHDNDQMPIRAAIVVGVVLVLAVVGAVLWFTRDDAPDPAPTAAPTATETPPDATAQPTTSSTSSSELGPSEVIPGWSSVEVAGITLPVSTEAGPHDLSDGRARDFERTELGAAMAAVHLAVGVSGYATPAVYEPTIADQVVAGENQQRLLSQAIATYEQASREQGRDDPSTGAVVRGYRVQAFSDEAATVEVWSEATGPQGIVRVGTPVEVVWTDAGWKLLAGADPQEGRELTASTTERFAEFPPEVR